MKFDSAVNVLKGYMQSSKAFVLIFLITTQCEAKPTKTTTENIDSADTTICPEELAKRKLEATDTILDEPKNTQKENLVKIKEIDLLPQPIHISFENSKGKPQQANLDKNLNLKPSDLVRLAAIKTVENSKQSSTDISIETTTICPEELEKQKLEEKSKTIAQDTQYNLRNEVGSSETKDHVENLGETSTEKSDETTTICPEELKRQKLEQKLNITAQDTQYNLRNDVGSSETKNDVENVGETSTEKSDETTTICPEELERQKLEEKSKTVAQDLQYNLRNEVGSSETKDHVENSVETSTEKSDEITTICPEELERQKLEEKSKTIGQDTHYNLRNEVGSSETKDHVENFRETSTDKFDETTTICPEELERQKLENNLNIILQKTPINLQNEEHVENSKQSSTETAKTNGNSRDSLPIKQDPVKLSEEILDETTTLCPEELAKRKLEETQEYLNKFKALVKKAQKPKKYRKRRQASSYSSYYVNQPSYNSQSVAVSNDKKTSSYSTLGYNSQGLSDSSNQNQAIYSPSQGVSASSSNKNQPGYSSQSVSASQANQNQASYQPQGYNMQNVAVSKTNGLKQNPPSYSPQGGLSAYHSNVKTYQQIQRQYHPAQTLKKTQNFYPKVYQNHLKPVKPYRNPSTYVRYPSNGSLKNYYRLNSVANRRQFQGARPSTTSRPVPRITRTKKFRPSPVFA